MELLPVLKKELTDLVIAKWSSLTGNSLDTPVKKYLTCTDKGAPRKKNDIENWSIRDCLLNEPLVRKFIDKCDSFRGNNLEDKINKFNGLKFYHTVYLDSRNECPIFYLDVYAIFIGFSNFKTFIKKSEGLNSNEKEEQILKLSGGKGNKEIINSFLKENLLLLWLLLVLV